MRYCYCTNPDNCTACRPAPEPPRTPEPLRTPEWWREIVTPYIPQNTGWVCPKCNKALAPWVSSCDCGNYTVNTTTMWYENGKGKINTTFTENGFTYRTCEDCSNLVKDGDVCDHIKDGKGIF